MKLLVTTSLCLISIFVMAQHKEHTVKAEVPPLSFQPVLSQMLSDSMLTDYKMDVTVMTITPGGIDTVSHRHDCELFGYVLEGSVEIALITKTTKLFNTGEMFYEKRNILHTVTKNGSATKPARVLLMFLIKNGRPGYTAEYPTKTK